MAEFKIGRLRFTWLGEWHTNRFYNRDAVVQYNGKTYICLVPHTSTDFYDGLYFVTESGASTPYWTLMLDGKTWKGQWLPNTAYSLGNIVVFGGTVYTCTTDHTSGAVALDPTKWAIGSKSDNYAGDWTVNTAYGLGDKVKYGGIVYNCITNHVSAATVALGLEDNLNDWEVFYSGIEYKENWATTTRYKLNDIVKRGATLWVATEGHTSTTSFDETKWDIWLPGEEYTNVWDDATVYQIGDLAKYGGYSYINKTANNVGLVPSVDSADWDIVTTGYRMQTEWSSTAEYYVGDVVRRGGRLFAAIADNSAHDPSGTVIRTNYDEIGSSGTTLVVVDTTGIVPGMLVIGNGFTQRQAVVSVIDETTLLVSAAPDTTPVTGFEIKFTGVNPQYWAIINPGTAWKNRWESGLTYAVGDVVVWQNATYMCVSNHSASDVLRPDGDTQGEIYWQIYALHARKNAMNTDGDLETYDNGVYTAVPIPLEPSDEVLRVNNRLPNWQRIYVVPDVYFVTPTGIDDPAYGKTLDRPWKTIKYACDYIGAGTHFTVTAGLLLQNRAFLVEEMYQWMLYQSANNNLPFSTLSEFDELKTKRDAGLIIDALAYDVARGGNSQTVAATAAYFVTEAENKFVNAGVASTMSYIIAALGHLNVLIADVILNNPVTTLYQVINDVETPIPQVFDSEYTSETDAPNEVVSLYTIINDALSAEDKGLIPLANQGLTATIMLKTGTYFETLPITIPENVALVGDELRGAVVVPATTINTVATNTDSITNRIALRSYADVEVGTPLQFIGSALTMFGGLTSGTTYYVIDLDLDLGVIVSEEFNGAMFTVSDGFGSMTVYGGDAIKNMFYVRNASGIRNMTLSGLLGTLGAPNQFTTQRPTGGAFVSLDPGNGPDDSSAWILRRSPYIQNVTNFGVGCVGAKIDGTLHNGGLKSIVANDFTQILSDGIGVWCTGAGSLTELVSVFAYYGYAGYMAEDGGRIRATNGNTSYGVYGVIAEGYDDTETPVTGNVYNRSTQVQASVQSSFGSNAQLLALQFANSGSAYNQSTTNMLKYSNHFETTASWTTDGNLVLQQNLIAPNGIAEAWTLTGLSQVAGENSVYQSMAIQPAGKVYTALEAINITGSGGEGANTPATFDVTVTASGYIVTVNDGGSGYVTNNTMYIPGSMLGGANTTNDCLITVASLAGSSILSVNNSGTVPTGSALSYTASAYVKKGTASSISLLGSFTGGTESGGGIDFNFDTGVITPYANNVGAIPLHYGKVTLPDGWFRIWVATYDTTGLNSALSFKLFPSGRQGSASYSYVYGAQTELSSATYEPSFYLETTSRMFTSYANFNIVGAGTGAYLIGDELRSKAVFQTRVIDTGAGEGGSGYLTASNAAQGGTDTYIILAGSDINTASNYDGMRVFINSGTGAGQYGFISAFDETLKIAQVLKESFDVLDVASTSSTGSPNAFTLAPGLTTESMYVDQAIQFIPTAYTTNIQSIAIDSIQVTGVLGGVINTFTVPSTHRLRVNQPVTFSGSPVGGVIADYTYYISSVPTETTFQVSTQPGGAAWALITATPGPLAMYVDFPTNDSYVNGSTTNMVPNMPIQFTGSSIGGISVGTTYYVNDVIDSSSFAISTSLVTVEVTATTASTDTFSVLSTADLIMFNPIIFSGTVFGNVVEDTKYYISSIPSSGTFTVVSSLIKTVASASEAGSNLITVTSTTGFIVNNAIKFIGTTFGDIVSERVYYILAINDDFTFTISATPGGSAVNLTTSVGELIVETVSTPFQISSASGSMTGTSAASKMTLSAGYGDVIGTYKSSLYGGVESGTTYYVTDLISTNKFAVSEIMSGTPISLVTKAGSMKVGEVGWDHINPGTAIATPLDSSSVYYVEPRTSFSEPGFSQSVATGVSLAPGNSWTDIAYGKNLWMALPSGTSTGATSVNGATWTSITLPAAQGWNCIEYGNGYWVAIGYNSSNVPFAAYSNSNGAGWRTASLPSSVVFYSSIAYGDGVFVALSSSSSDCAYSTDFGKTWIAGNNLPSASWNSVAYGNGKFIAVASSGTNAAYSLDGISWVGITLPVSGDWSTVAYGNGRFVTTSSTSNVTMYSFNGTSWTQSHKQIAANKLAYGQGVFVALLSNGSSGYTSEDGMHWKPRSVTSSNYGALAFGYIASTFVGQFITLAGTNTGSIISAGVKAKGRAVITSGVITSVSQWEPGSNYNSEPTVTFTDPNVTTLAAMSTRLGNGALGNPTFFNRGTGYSTSSTRITITGSGYADAYQTGLTIIVKNLTKLPQPGDNLVIEGVTQIYKITSATPAFGTTAPNIEANIQIAPGIEVVDSPDEGTPVTIRQKYSQVRLTGHDFLNVGYGNIQDSNYPGLPTNTILSPQDQAVEVNFGRVFYTSTDQDGNFKVGSLFAVEQATGIVTLSASQFGLSGLDTISLGGIAVGGQSVVIRQFSTDATFVANSNEIIPTQKSIKSYLTGRLSQGGSNTFTGQLIAGTVLVGGPDKIASTIPEGTLGSNVEMRNKVMVQGTGAGWGGDGAAMAFFMKSWNHR